MLHIFYVEIIWQNQRSWYYNWRWQNLIDSNRQKETCL